MDKRTAKYRIKVLLDITEQNRYGDELGTGGLSYTHDLEADSLAELGTVLEKLENVIRHPKER